MKTLPRRLQPTQHLFHLALVFSFLLISASSSWAINILVTNTNDMNMGSLRAAIAIANANAGADVITFDPLVFPPPPSAPGVISLASQLPALTGAGDTVDGSGAGVVLDGSALSGSEIGLRVRNSNITVRNLTIQNFPSDGLRVDTQGPSATVTGVLITYNTINSNGNRGIRVTGGTGPLKTLAATVRYNTLFENIRGITVHGNLGDLSSGDPGGNTVTAWIIGNTVKRSNQGANSSALFSGDGIQIVGGIGDGSDNMVMATVSNNDVKQNSDDGIVVVGCGLQDAGSNNTVYATINDNVLENNGLNSTLTRNNGIVVSGATGEQGTDTTCDGNTVSFNISNNDSKGNKTRNILVSGGTGMNHDVSGTIWGNLALGVTPLLTTQEDGIQVSGGVGTGANVHDITVSGNTSMDNLDQGIVITGGRGDNNTVDHVLIGDNISMRNSNDGINVTVGTGTNNSVSVDGITNNETNRNGRDGIRIGSGIPGSGATPVSGNQADRNGQDGIDIDSTGYTLSNNQASRNAVDGINALGNTNGSGNTAAGNASCNTPGCF